MSLVKIGVSPKFIALAPAAFAEGRFYSQAKPSREPFQFSIFLTDEEIPGGVIGHAILRPIVVSSLHEGLLLLQKLNRDYPAILNAPSSRVLDDLILAHPKFEVCEVISLHA